MKRHTALVPLSREHHGALILSRLLQKDAPAYRDLPSDSEGKALYAIKFYNQELIKHFKEEEIVLNLVTGVNETLDLMVQAILNEHQEFHELFNLISGHPEITLHLDNIGRLLEIHIRKEERELFPLIEKVCSEDLMASLSKNL